MSVVYNVINQKLYRLNPSEVIATDQIGFVDIEVRFEGWDGYDNKRVQIVQNDQIYNCLLVDDRCKLPTELAAGMFYVTIIGTQPNGSRATTNALCDCIVASGYKEGGEPPVPPTPDLYAQLLQNMDVSIEKSVPKIGENGHWLVWSAELGEYIDTGVPASGGGGGVTDVQVVGESVVQDGVANVPFATSDVAGVLKIGSGLFAAGEGKVVVDFAGTEAIDARASSRSIGANRLVYSVNSVLCSTAANEQLTTGQQLAGRQRLGIGETMVGDVTLTDETNSVIFELEPNNFINKYKSISLYIELPKIDGATTANATLSIAYKQSGEIKRDNIFGSQGASGRLPNLGAYAHTIVYTVKISKKNISTAQIFNDYGSRGYPQQVWASVANRIDERDSLSVGINFYITQAMPVGTRLVLYGEAQ